MLCDFEHVVSGKRVRFVRARTSPSGRCTHRLEAVMEEIKTRNRLICAERASGMTLQEIGHKHGITRERVRQITARKNGEPQTLIQFPGSEGLTPVTRGLLIRLGCRSVEEVIKALKERRIRPYSATGMGQKRYDEIVAWASSP